MTEQDLAEGRLYPPLDTIRECSTSIAAYIAEHAYKTGKHDLVTFTLHRFEINFFVENRNRFDISGTRGQGGFYPSTVVRLQLRQHIRTAGIVRMALSKQNLSYHR